MNTTMSSHTMAANQAARVVSMNSNVHTAAYFAASILGLFVMILLAHWIGDALERLSFKNSSPLLRVFISTSRYAMLFKNLDSSDLFYRIVRGILHLKIPGFTSFGHGCVFTLYLAINVTLMFQNLHGNLPSNFAKRMGW